MDEDPRLTELDIEVITITCDGDGCVTFDAGGISVERASFLLRSAEFLMMTDFWYEESDEEPDDE